jgi:hypothetical protein
MKTHEEIESITAKLGVKIRPVNDTSFKAVHKYVQDDETIVSILDSMGCLAVLTNKRILYVASGIFSGVDMKEIYLDKISGVKADMGIIQHDLIITSVGATMKFPTSKKDELVAFQNKLTQAMADYNKPIQQAAPVDVVSQLERLADLKTKGILTDEEFAEQKKKILSQS